MPPKTRLPWWKWEIDLSRLRSPSIFLLGFFGGAVLYAIVGICLHQIPLGGDWLIMTIGCVVFGLGMCGLVECGRLAGRLQSTKRISASLVFMIAVMIVSCLLKPAQFKMRILELGIFSCALFPVFGAFAVVRDACRSIFAWRNARKENGD